MKKTRKKKGVKRKKPSLISILFELLISKNKDATTKLKLFNEDKSKKISKSKESLDVKLKEVKEVKDRKLRPELKLPKLSYVLDEMPKIDYGALFSYLGNLIKTKYDEYKAFKHDGEGRIEFEQDVEYRKYERIVEKEMMAEFGFFAMEHTKPEEQEAYDWDRRFGFGRALIYLQAWMKPGSLRIVPGIMYFDAAGAETGK